MTRGQTLFRLVPIQPSERDAGVTPSRRSTRPPPDATSRRSGSSAPSGWSRTAPPAAVRWKKPRRELAVAEAELKAARDRLALATRSGVSSGGVVIEAPDSAIVQNVFVRDGQAVAAGMVLIELVRLATVWVRVPVYAGEAGALDTRAPAQVLMLGEDTDAAGVTARPIVAPPSANPSTAGVDLYYALPNPDNRFRPGERVAVRLTRRDAESGLVVPKAALLHDAYGGTWVYVATRAAGLRPATRGGHRHQRRVWPCCRRARQPGTRVVTDGAAELFGVEFGAGK